MNRKSVAPCGINCSVCYAFLREKNRCAGCRTDILNKPVYCQKCIIKNCSELSDHGWKFCSHKCEKYPCLRLKNLDKRYRTKYGTSMIENLENIEKFGIDKFIESEKRRWKCHKCGELLCVHRNFCLKCKNLVR
jgi:hypothetical protein